MSSTRQQTSTASPPGVEESARAITGELRALRDPDRAKGVQQYFKHALVALGIDTPTLRALVRRQIDQLKPVWTVTEALALCDRLLQEPELEIRGTGILVLSGFKKELAPDLLPVAQRWLKTRLDNWALVDSFCSLVLSPLLERHAPVEATLRRWSGDKLLWVRRAALVTLVPFARRGRFLDLSYELAREHFPDPEDLMHKATGWLLREAGKTDRPRLKEFVLQHGPSIPRTSLRYAIERFPAAERLELLEATRSLASAKRGAAPRRLSTEASQPNNEPNH